ncbi:MAG: DMT family transporter [Vicinamibacterales bacterium]
MTPLDAWLLLMVIIWGANFTLVKVGIAAMPAQAFNAGRLGVAGLVFAVVIAWGVRMGRRPGPAGGWQTLLRPTPMPWRDWALVCGLGVVGHVLYQLCFIQGLPRTTAANSSLILACSPVFVAFLSAAAGHERIRPQHWAGVALSVGGMYLVAGRDVTWSSESARGDLIMLVASILWAAYTVGSRPFVERYSPLLVTGYGMIFGALLYLALVFPTMVATDWSAIGWTTWLAMVASGVLALNLAYVIWYVAVQRLGSARTSVWSNFTPIVAMAVGVAWIGERVDAMKILGAAAILAGVALTRLGGGRVPDVEPLSE